MLVSLASKGNMYNIFMPYIFEQRRMYAVHSTDYSVYRTLYKVHYIYIILRTKYPVNSIANRRAKILYLVGISQANIAIKL